MITMLKDLLEHQGYTNAALLKVIRSHDGASRDQELKRLLHHIVLANRFWLHTMMEKPFSVEHESQVPESLDSIAATYRETHVLETLWLSKLKEDDLARTVETPFIPGKAYTLAQALIQVCMHSHGHRSQCATRLRSLGGQPPVLDFILWLKERPAPDWA